MFPVACAHCILTTKYALSLFLKWCVFTNHKSAEKTYHRIISRPEHAEDISSIYLLNQIFKSVSDLFAKEIS